MKTMALPIAMVVLPWTLAAQVAPPSPMELIDRAIAATKAQSERNWRYTFREDHSQTQLDKKGRAGTTETRTYDHIMLEGSEYRKLVLIDGKPLDPKAQKKVDEDLEKTRTQRRRGLLNFHRTVSLGTLEFLARLFDSKVTGEEIIDGHKTWRMESEPKASYKPANKQEEEALASRRVNWFSQDDGYRIRGRSEFIRAANGFQPGTVIDSQAVRVGEVWLAGDAFMKADMKWMPGVRGRVDSHQHYYDYKRFTADSTFTPE